MGDLCRTKGLRSKLGLRHLARGRGGVQDSCLRKPKKELHGKLKVNAEVGKFINQKNKSSQGKGGVLSGLPRTLLCLGVLTQQGKVFPSFIC
jgi:hypothetical protein